MHVNLHCPTVEESPDTIGGMPALPADAPAFVRKLALLLERDGRAASAVSQAAGQPVNAIGNLLSRGSVPRATIAAQLSKALGVSTDYLSDDDVPVEPLPRGRGDHLTTEELLRESAVRYRTEALRLLRLFELIRAKNYEPLHTAIYDPARAHELVEIGTGEVMDMLFYAATIGPNPLELLLHLSGLDLYARRHHAELPGADRSPDEVGFRHLLDDFEAFMKEQPGLMPVAFWVAQQVELVKRQGKIEPGQELAEVLSQTLITGQLFKLRKDVAGIKVKG